VWSTVLAHERIDEKQVHYVPARSVCYCVLILPVSCISVACDADGCVANEPLSGWLPLSLSTIWTAFDRDQIKTNINVSVQSKEDS